MADVEPMTVAEPGDYLSEESDGFLLCEWSVVGHVVKQLSAFDVFQNKIPGTKLEA